MFKSDQYILQNLMRFRKIFNSIVAGHSCKHLCECLSTFFFFFGAFGNTVEQFFSVLFAEIGSIPWSHASVISKKLLAEVKVYQSTRALVKNIAD